jgi:hypothetical protein
VHRRRAILAFVQMVLPSDPADWPPDTGKLLADKSPSRLVAICLLRCSPAPTGGDRTRAALLRLLTAASGTSRQFAATQHFGRFRSEADIE